jgi:hypothetical protein
MSLSAVQTLAMQAMTLETGLATWELYHGFWDARRARKKPLLMKKVAFGYSKELLLRLLTCS